MSFFPYAAEKSIGGICPLDIAIVWYKIKKYTEVKWNT